MDKIKRYIECYVPTEACNLRCHYCYITQYRKFNNKIATFSHTPKEIRKALSKERLGGTCLLNFCAGGETLLSDEVLPIVKELILEGHYVMLVTNGTPTKRFEEIATWSKDLLSHLIFKFSFHYLELKRLGSLERYFDNIQMIKNTEASFTVEITPSDELVPFIEEIKQCCLDNLGTLCHVTIARDDRTQTIDHLSNYSFDEYKKIWGQFNSELFNFKTKIFYVHRNEFCYAGDWSLNLNLETGYLQQCYCGKGIDNIYKNINAPLHFEAIGKKCTLAHCYNGHALLSLGAIPEININTYANVRNRQCTDGSEWLKPKMKSFISSKLCESNKEYSFLKKNLIAVKNIHIKSAIYQQLIKIKRKILPVKR